MGGLLAGLIFYRFTLLVWVLNPQLSSFLLKQQLDFPSWAFRSLTQLLIASTLKVTQSARVPGQDRTEPSVRSTPSSAEAVSKHFQQEKSHTLAGAIRSLELALPVWGSSRRVKQKGSTHPLQNSDPTGKYRCPSERGRSS